MKNTDELKQAKELLFNLKINENNKVKKENTFKSYIKDYLQYSIIKPLFLKKKDKSRFLVSDNINLAKLQTYIMILMLILFQLIVPNLFIVVLSAVALQGLIIGPLHLFEYWKDEKETETVFNPENIKNLKENFINGKIKNKDMLLSILNEKLNKQELLIIFNIIEKNLTKKDLKSKIVKIKENNGIDKNEEVSSPIILNYLLDELISEQKNNKQERKVLTEKDSKIIDDLYSQVSERENEKIEEKVKIYV